MRTIQKSTWRFGAVVEDRSSVCTATVPGFFSPLCIFEVTTMSLFQRIAGQARWRSLFGCIVLLAVSVPQAAFAQQPGLSGFNASPASISFAANNPGNNIAGSSVATVTWVRAGKPGGTWTLNVRANSATFTGCTTVPSSAVSVMCSSATHSLTSQNGSAACSAGSFITLPSTAPGVQLAGGAIASTGNAGNQTDTFTVTLNYRLADSWRFLPNMCPLSLTYTLTDQR